MPMGLKPTQPLVADMREPSYKAYYDRRCEQIHHARGCVSQLGGLAKPAQDRTQPFGTLAQPLLSHAKAEIARTKAQEPRRR